MADQGRTGFHATKHLAALLRHEAASGVVLLAAAIAAFVIDNSPLKPLYDALLDTPVALRIATFELDEPLLFWINDGLMTIFFFLVGLEIKRELVEGRLSSWQSASFPLVAAVGGMIAPALIYVAINHADALALRGWAIPAATDIAFALGVLTLLGNRISGALKVFLLALAIIDDLGAILIIAIFYTSGLSLISLSIAAVAALGLFALNRIGVRRIWPYIFIGLVLWVAVLKSGVHATIAGVVVALMIPLKGNGDIETAPAARLEHALEPWVTFGVMPLFAFANAGLSLSGLGRDALLSPVPLGIALGLVIGKQIGIISLAALGAAVGICNKPEGTSWGQIYGVAILGGIGFTMSLFIGTLAFHDAEHAALLRIGVIAGSLLSGIAGYCVLRFAVARRARVS